jgi:hypothetical protein
MEKFPTGTIVVTVIDRVRQGAFTKHTIEEIEIITKCLAVSRFIFFVNRQNNRNKWFGRNHYNTHYLGVLYGELLLRRN